MTTKLRLSTACISLLMHLSFLLLMSLVLYRPSSPVILGDNRAMVVQSYLSEIKPKPIVKKQLLEKINKANIALKSVMKKKENHNEPKLKTNSHSKGQEQEALLMLLHEKIQAAQHYPLSAQQMERQGRVRIGFLLLPDGSIEELQIIASSGTYSLDQAALKAVQESAPFSEAKEYIKTAKTFNIDVVFELA